jgi:hypothetical protein
MSLSLVTAILALALAPAAFAQNVSGQGYGGQGAEVAAVTAGGDPGDPSSTGSASSGSLPFTGLDVTLLAGGGLLLLLIGVGMSRAVKDSAA